MPKTNIPKEVVKIVAMIPLIKTQNKTFVTAFMGKANKLKINHLMSIIRTSPWLYPYLTPTNQLKKKIICTIVSRDKGVIKTFIQNNQQTLQHRAKVVAKIPSIQSKNKTLLLAFIEKVKRLKTNTMLQLVKTSPWLYPFLSPTTQLNEDIISCIFSNERKVIETFIQNNQTKLQHRAKILTILHTDLKTNILDKITDENLIQEFLSNYNTQSFTELTYIVKAHPWLSPQLHNKVKLFPKTINTILSNRRSIIIQFLNNQTSLNRLQRVQILTTIHYNLQQDILDAIDNVQLIQDFLNITSTKSLVNIIRNHPMLYQYCSPKQQSDFQIINAVLLSNHPTIVRCILATLNSNLIQYAVRYTDKDILIHCFQFQKT